MKFTLLLVVLLVAVLCVVLEPSHALWWKNKETKRESAIKAKVGDQIESQPAAGVSGPDGGRESNQATPQPQPQAERVDDIVQQLQEGQSEQMQQARLPPDPNDLGRRMMEMKSRSAEFGNMQANRIRRKHQHVVQRDESPDGTYAALPHPLPELEAPPSPSTSPQPKPPAASRPKLTLVDDEVVYDAQVDDKLTEEIERRSNQEGELDMVLSFAQTNVDEPNALDRQTLRPVFQARAAQPPATADAAAAAGSGPKSSGSSLKKFGDKLTRTTKKVFTDLIHQSRINTLIGSVESDMKFVRDEFSKFSMIWAPIVERALNYLGTEHLDKIKYDPRNELDLSHHALYSLVFSYELMRLMVVWRQKLLLAHEAFKLYLETYKKDVLKITSDLDIDEAANFALRTTHNYMLLNAWLQIDDLTSETKLKLNYLFENADNIKKQYESDYFRHIVVLQETYEPTINEIQKEQDQTINALSFTGVNLNEFDDVLQYFKKFTSTAESTKINGIDWRIPRNLEHFMERFSSQLSYNPIIYDREFLKFLLKKQREAKAV